MTRYSNQTRFNERRKVASEFRLDRDGEPVREIPALSVREVQRKRA
jgi:hypothetical protein